MKKRAKLIYVIDDAGWHNVLTEKMLKDCGYKVVTFTDGHSLLKNLVKVKPHLIITDVNMPELDGIELCDRVKKQPSCSNIPVMYLTSLDKEEVRKRENGGCGAGFIQKPLIKKSFLDAVARRVYS